MALDRKPDPPRTIEEWRVWEDACIQTLNRQWLPQGEPSAWWPFDAKGSSEGFWYPTAKGHPFAGTYFCWRCIAEAQGFPPRVTGHVAADDAEILCFQATRNETPVDSEPDTREAEGGATPDVGVLSAALSDSPLQWQTLDVTEVRPVFHALEGSPFPWPKPGTPCRIAFQGVTLEATFGGYVTPDVSEGSFAEVEPAAPDESERAPQHGAEPVQAHEADHRDTWPPSWTDSEVTPSGHTGTGGDS